MAKKEIELRFFIGESIKTIEEKINHSLHYKFLKEVTEEDIYYTSKHKDFITSEECLRIRDVNGNCEITWKPATTDDMLFQKSFWKEEINLSIRGTQKEIAKALLQSLDFVECSIVKKKRVYYKIDRHTLLTLDYIDQLGWFVEIETISEDESISLIKNRQIAKKLQLSLECAINIPYRDLVQDNKSKKIYLQQHLAIKSA
ncbi:MAG: class IV adenylate cyclase [Candidatus Kuenenia stuttgartiensis]|nr:class IV adenylate cyclase [Candidatus Kuenenia stuttgartiensis]